jgi:cytochrome P450/NADPH-cytochrome P450 reductase
MWSNEAEYRSNIAELHRQCDEIVAARRKNPDPNAHDLLNNMIMDSDPKTGEHLSDENIRFQMVTFLIAGHETTSGMLSFATYYMLKYPTTFAKAREEADAAIKKAGGSLLKINPADLKYIDAICKETLRLQPSAPAWSVTPKSKDGETLPGGYHVEHNQSVFVLLSMLHRDPKAWGEDAEAFRPERFLDGRKILPDAWKPFGNGQRACIGRGFAMQEAVLAIALIVARFDLEMEDPAYDLEIKQTLTIKPHNFKIVARPRFGRNQSILSELLASASGTNDQVYTTAAKGDAAHSTGGHGEKIYVLYGSNSGSCEGLAKEIASEGDQRGFNMSLGELDSVAGGGKLPTDAPVIIVTASYEGQPTDNARMFVGALAENKDTDSLKGVRYMVMGAGHHDWAQTFHKIPKFIDSRLAELGAERLEPLSTGDAGEDIVGDFEAFKALVWKHFGGGAPSGTATPKVKEEDGAQPFLLLPRSANPAAATVGCGIETVGTVVDQEVLTRATENSPQTNQITIQLPKGQVYRAGDYLAVFPKNPQPTVDRALEHFGQHAEDTVVFNRPTSFFPLKLPMRLGDVLSSFVELGQPVSKLVLPQLAQYSDDEAQKHLQALEANYAKEVIGNRLSLLDLVLTTPGCRPPLDVFLANLPKMKIRQYSISSTPLENPEEVTLTFTVHTAPSAAGDRVLGVASNYLAFLSRGDELLCTVKGSAGFHLPADPETPVVLFAAGSGVAPFFGFIAERAQMAAGGRTVGRTVLYYGTRTPAEVIRKDKFAQWVQDGVLEFRPVLSRSDAAEIEGLPGVALLPEAKYVQDRVWADKDDMAELFAAGAQYYTCGSGKRLGNDLKQTLVKIIAEKKPEGDKETPEAIMERLARERYRTDVFL